MWEHDLFIDLCFQRPFFPSMHLSSFLILCLKETSEGSLAKDTFGGRFVTFQTSDSVYIDLNEKTLIQAYSSSFYRLTPDFIAERLGHANFSELRELDLPHCSLRTVDLGTKDVFINLRRLVSPTTPLFLPTPPLPAPLSLVTWAHSQSLRLCQWDISFTSRENEERHFINIVSRHNSSSSKRVKPCEVDFIAIVMCLVQLRSLAFSSFCERAKRHVQYWTLPTFVARKK